MAVFRKINTSFWQDTFVLDLTPEEKYFYLYLMTNTKTSQCGIYEIPKKIIEIETGYNRETVDKLIARFVTYKKVLYSEKTKELMLLNWIKFNGSSSPKVLSRVVMELKEIKNKELVKKYILLSNGYNYKFDTVSILYPYSIDTQSQEEEEEEEEEEEVKEKEEERVEIIPSTPKKIKYGEFEKVTLLEIEFEKLLEKLGQDLTVDLIERLDNYKASTGKTYKSDYATILNWSKKEPIKTNKTKGSSNPFLEMMQDELAKGGNQYE